MGTKILLFILQGLLLSCLALEDEAQGDGPFKEPLEPGMGETFSVDANRELAGYKVIKAVPKNPDQLGFLKLLLEQNSKMFNIDFWKAPKDIGSGVDMMVSPKDFAKISKSFDDYGMEYSAMVEDVEGAVEKENEKHSGTMFSTYSGFDYGRYHNLREITSEMNSLAKRYSNAQVFSVGRSYEGRDMQAIKIMGKRKANKKMFFFNCAIHAREWITAASCIYMINEMLTKYGKDSSVTAMLDKMDFVVMPVLNVDGYSYTWYGGRARMWRKTRSRGSRCRGADPNRNWDYKWGGVGTSRSECDDTYHGRSAFSEIEVRNVANYLSRNKNSLAGYMDIHAYSQLWMTPWGYTRRYPRDYSEMMRVANIAVRALRSMYGTYYRAGTSSNIIYATSGGSDDWTYGKLGLVYSYALELRDRGRYGFLLPANQILPTAKETFAAIKAMAAAMKI
eukprot:Seg1675.1 transcript_id=Seg1675.1/GoldUCD/mRNA.D3Y31 product="Carboxypeptidase A2" protein_id=Seg1675.1/GoldUCD/D3Y31